MLSALLSLSLSLSFPLDSELLLAKTAETKLPPGGAEWDLIGTFRLQGDSGKSRIVKLYVYDVRAIEDKLFKQRESVLRVTPSEFQIHAMYATGTNKWTHATLLNSTRLTFSKIVERTPRSITIELTPLWITTRNNEELRKPLNVSIVLSDGFPKLNRSEK